MRNDSRLHESAGESGDEDASHARVAGFSVPRKPLDATDKTLGELLGRREISCKTGRVGGELDRDGLVSPSMTPNDAQQLHTRQSLLGRLKNWEDERSWRDFFETYWRLIYGTARKV